MAEKNRCILNNPYQINVKSNTAYVKVPSVYDIQNTKIVINSRLINRVDLDPLSDNIILHMHTFIYTIYV